MALNMYALAMISYGSDHLFLSVTVSNIVINICKVCWRCVRLAQKVLLLNGSVLLAKPDDINNMPWQQK